jgi:hypothetical protein
MPTSVTPADPGVTGFRNPAEMPRTESLAANDALPRPSWWKGSCDSGDNGISYKLAANFDGLQACGPGSDQSGQDYLVNFFPGAWGEFEWECVELAMRWMYQAWGVPPYGANGNGVVWNYPNGRAGWPHLQKVRNGTPHASPEPGDVISIDNADEFGHTEVVTAASVNGQGDGTLTAITENYGAASNGWATLTVHDWTVSDGNPDDTVLGWLHNPAWTLQQPLLWRVADGALDVQDSGGLRGTWTTIATGIEQAQLIGGDGWEAAPILVALTTAGQLEAEYYLPGLSGREMTVVADNVTSFAVAAAEGARGQPVLAWVNTHGDFEAAIGGLGVKPVVEATGVGSIAIAPDSGPNGALVGYLSTAGTFYDKIGSTALDPTSPWSQVATGVSQIALAGGGMERTSAVRAYLQGGVFYAARSFRAPFTPVAPNVSQIAVTTIGTSATPLLAYVTTAGVLETEIDRGSAAAFSQQATGVASVSVAAGPTGAGFPSVAWVTTAGALDVCQGELNGTWIGEGTGLSQGGIGALTVS